MGIQKLRKTTKQAYIAGLCNRGPTSYYYYYYY